MSNGDYDERNLVNFEIADHAPPSQDALYFRIPLKNISHISPTMKNVFKKFSVLYFLRCVIVMENDKKEPGEEASLEVMTPPYELILVR